MIFPESNGSPPPSPFARRFVARIPLAAERCKLNAELTIPAHAQGLVLFVHGCGSRGMRPRNCRVAELLGRAGLASMLLDLLTPDEERVPAIRFDLDLLTRRLVMVTRWAAGRPETVGLTVGYLAAGQGAAAAIRAAGALRPLVRAVVSRGGRPDLADDDLDRVPCPILLVVGGADEQVLAMNRDAFARLHGRKALETVPGASHEFEECGAIEVVAALAGRWFRWHLVGNPRSLYVRTTP